MTVEIIALVEKNYGQKVLEEMKSSPGVLQILNAAGRSSDLFEDKQFGTFGEAAIVTIVADDKGSLEGPSRYRQQRQRQARTREELKSRLFWSQLIYRLPANVLLHNLPL